MADPVPIRDVLCQAMEYLSKLGSNLRIRTENLKEKRIRKDKLKNTHAVQKAANKVLLICELSKKSIENVESGVKKILTHIGASQAHDGGKVKISSYKSINNYKWEYIEYESQKLRIRNKVHLKHFMSVKVTATAMTTEIQDKYPVYHNCKLYRIRKGNEKLTDVLKGQNRKSESECEKISNQSESKSQSAEDIVQLAPPFKYNVQGDTLINNKSTIMESDVLDIQTSVKECLFSDKSEEPKGVTNLEDCVFGTPIVGCSDNSKNEKSMQVDDTEKDLNTIKTTSKIRSERSSERKKKYRNIKVIDDSSESESAIEKETCDSNVENNKGVLSKNPIAYGSKENDSETSMQLNKNKEENISQASSPTEKHVENENNIAISFVDQQKVSNEELMVTNKNVPDKNENVQSSTLKDNQEISIEESNPTETENTVETKPLIKCVSINKLLKTDIIHKTKPCIEIIDSDSDDVVNKNKRDNSSSNCKKTKRIQNKPRHKSNENREKPHSKENEDSEYWKLKKKEVNEFKAKKFVINITRLPKLSSNYLVAHRLSKIVQNGVVICEIAAKPLNTDKNEVLGCSSKYTLIKDSAQNEKKYQNKPSEDIDSVKNALLIDSDSDDSAAVLTNSNKVKKVLSNEVDSDIISNKIVDKLPQIEKIKSCNDNIASDEPDKQSCIIEKVSSDINDTVVNDKSDDQPQIKENTSCQIINTTANKTSDDCLDKSIQSGSENTGCEKSTDILRKSTETIKKALLHDSNSETDKMTHIENEQVDNICEETKTATQCILDKNDPKKIKFSLLHSSSDENLNLSSRKNKRKSENISPSKRKHIMESMHAKKMLLTYSSSSDTDDEQLKSVLKEIRDSLLKGSDKEDSKSAEESQSDNSDLECQKNKPRLTLTSDEPNSSAKDINSQVDGSAEENSNSSSKKMGGSKMNAPESSSQNSNTRDSNDKDIDGLTNLKNLRKKHRRRRSSSSASTRKTRSRLQIQKTMPKVPQISDEGFLQAESSSDAGSGSDCDIVEELPPVSLGLNGDSIGHMAKDDLLEDSVSSSSHNERDKSSQDVKEESSSDEEENVKSRRRKANAISSDSEAGGSRKKDKVVRISDFEDSEDDSSEPAKRNKRKKKESDSDASAASSEDGSKKKRKRIKHVDDSDGSGSETENEGRNKHGRKNIRKVMGKNQLEEATKKAAREEKERIARITERQKLYNNLEFDESGKPDEVVLDKVVLDFDPETKEPLIEVDKGLVKKLKPHQANGIKFMWNACFESVKRIKKDKGSGCILAHCMGLGKTLQVVALAHTLLAQAPLTGVRRVLVVCPLSTVLNWVSEFRMWLRHARAAADVDLYELSRYKQNSERAFQLQQWFKGGGVCVLGYEMFRNLSADNNKKFKKKMLRNFQEALVDPGPDLVVCDEGHLLKNEKTSLSQAMNRIVTLRRIVLTGTPLQNNLKEYYCMVQFVKPNLLGKYNEYLNRFVNPITNGQYTDSTEHDIRIMKRRSHVLHKMLDGAVQRRDYGVLAPFLPPKHEYVLFITLTEIQIKLYQHYLDNYSRRPMPGKSSGFLFPDFQSLQRIWTHPLVLKYNSERYEIMQQKKREREEEDSEGSLVDFIDDDSTPDESSTEDSSDDMSDASDDSRKKSKKKKAGKKSKAKDQKVGARRGTRSNPIDVDEEEPLPDVTEVKYENPTEWWVRLLADDELEDLRHSHKLVLLFDILRQCEAIGDKLLVFSQSLYSLDLIEHFLGKVDEATQEARVDEKLNGHVGSWSPGIDYFRLDGSTSCENRSIWCKNFNREDNPRARLFLISTRAGGLGINLVAANRVVIFDVSWNPSHDVQSIFRVYRFGQKKPCYVYRFLAMGTMEEKIYERQVTKQAISKRVIDEQQIDRHYAENDLAELYKFEPEPPAPRELPPLPKDRLFAEMLREHEAQIYKYHEHDSLLENKEEETLTEEERKAAWEDFENEKTRPPPAPFANAYMNNGMMPGLLAQQQQLAYAALAAMLRKDMPNINDNQIRDMMPLIYQANPGMFGGYDYGLMQKMSEIYKYAPGMMNPGMMNPVMNPGAGAAGAMSGSSGLQYEPPWQRQQQQQHQMRLQQLMQQQQQSMGAKYYAGGLGSRDPMAMALQQQRAREMMLGERGRARGRPPTAVAAARPPGAPPADVVNLDSD